MYRIRVRFTKMNLMKFISHLDLMRLMERTLRRSNIPLAFTQGFNPHPKIAFATALAIGISSEGEYMDVEITQKISLNDFKNSMNKNLPSGIEIIKCKYINLDNPSLMATVEISTYIVKCKLQENYEISLIQEAIDDFQRKTHIYTIKNIKKRNKDIKKEIDIRPLINSIEVWNLSSKELVLKIRTATGSKGNLKPEVLIDKLIELEALCIDRDTIRIHRLDLYISADGSLVTPMDIAT